MSRVAKNPIQLPKGVDVDVSGAQVSVKGPKGELSLNLHPAVNLEQKDGVIRVQWKTDKDLAMAGTYRALVSNMVTGVSEGFQKKLQLVGVGYQLRGAGRHHHRDPVADRDHRHRLRQAASGAGCGGNPVVQAARAL